MGKGSALQLAAAVTPNCAPSTCQKINLVQPQPVLRHQNRLHHACLIITRTTSRVCGGGSVASVGVGSCAHPRLIVRYCVLQQPHTLHCMYTLMLCCLRYCTNKLYFAVPHCRSTRDLLVLDCTGGLHLGMAGPGITVDVNLQWLLTAHNWLVNAITTRARCACRCNSGCPITFVLLL